jgi:hypothetical protein
MVVFIKCFNACLWIVRWEWISWDQLMGCTYSIKISPFLDNWTRAFLLVAPLEVKPFEFITFSPFQSGNNFFSFCNVIQITLPILQFDGIAHQSHKSQFKCILLRIRNALIKMYILASSMMLHTMNFKSRLFIRGTYICVYHPHSFFSFKLKDRGPTLLRVSHRISLYNQELV